MPSARDGAINQGMCGRFALNATPQDVRALFGFEEQPNFPPRENVSPTEPIGVVVAEHGVRRFVLMRWGFLPAWCKDPANFPLLFNARGETLADKPAFRNAVRRRRCLVPADGFYEWAKDSRSARGGKVPYLVRRRDGCTAALAGLWETYVGPDGGEIDTAAIVTTHANGLIAAIHDRMPVIVEPADFGRWLDAGSEDAREALALIRSAADDVLVMEPCDPAVPRPMRPRPAASRPPVPHAAPAEPPDEPPAQGSLF